MSSTQLFERRTAVNMTVNIQTLQQANSSWMSPGDEIFITHKYKPFILFDLDLNTRMAFSVLLALTWLLAMAGKYTIFKIIFNTGFSERPINVLTLFYQVVDVITRSIHIPSIVVLLSGKPLAHFVGSEFCPFFHATVINGFGLRSYGSLAISFCRFIYVKKQKFIMGNRYMEWIICFTLLAFIICWTSFLLALYLTVNSPSAYLKEMCHGYNSEFLLIFLEYSGGTLTQTWLHKILIVVLIVPHFVTAVLYGILFMHIYKHNQTMSAVLTKQAINNRNRANAMTCGCEMFGFATDVLMYLFFLLTGAADLFPKWRPHSTIIWQFEFAVKTTIQALAGADTRRIFLGIIGRTNIFRSGLNISKILDPYFQILRRFNNTLHLPS